MILTTENLPDNLLKKFLKKTLWTDLNKWPVAGTFFNKKYSEIDLQVLDTVNIDERSIFV